MDPAAVNVNVTVDDFDSIITYENPSLWDTPDPSIPDFPGEMGVNTPWWMGTFHETRQVGAVVGFNFTGPAIYVYGNSGPAFGSFEVNLDGIKTNYSAYAAKNATTPYVLFKADNLTYSKHQLSFKNLGAGSQGPGDIFFLDYMQQTIQVAPAGATVSNVTVQEDDPAISYSGDWGNNTSTNFNGGGTTFTHQNGASMTFTFNGSAIYVFGDKKNDHGLYQVTVDSNPPELYDDVSGCGSAFAMTCEQQKPCLKFLGSNLGEGQHTMKIENIAPGDLSFFDFDSITLTVPSVYAPRDLDPNNGTSASGGVSGPKSSGLASASAALTPAVNLQIIFLYFFAMALLNRRV
ncbi:hypothetical protein BDN72DRAFT_960023 [Pluteus cervinus]|uniref:Uncharacterized protein n=1 Tax=Pluteus cervinus TaxID=181527 RepID=A0ACD3AU61_9AGAR|nr:hypothetical protein BDN72DRAFT_960023 [Pluteus cervinus]